MTLQEQASSDGVMKEEEAALKELVNKIFIAAIGDLGTDIHIDPAAEETKVKFRIDGVVHDVLSLPKNVHLPLVSRIKGMADMEAENRRSIQYGRIFLGLEGREYDLRATVIPAFYGETVALRILGGAYWVPKIEQIGYREPDRKRIEKCLGSPTGLIVFSGPSGCGKTTAMQAWMQTLVSPEKRLFSIEDPVEFRIPGVNHIGLNRKTGMLFPDILRGLQRSDPDIIMVGELPDGETANICLNAALTGHLVLTQLHAKWAQEAIFRLVEIGVDPFLVAEGLVMVSCQQLVRRVCADCAQEMTHPAGVITEWRKRAEADGLTWPEAPPAFRRGKGCENCRGTGYRGRTGIYEILAMDRELAEMVASRADLSGLRTAAIGKGMTTMFADGLAKAMVGETTVEEVLRVVGG